MIRIGTSGWNYRNWKDDFYLGVPQRRWLSHLSKHFPAVEVNATYYRTPKTETLAQWIQSTPNDFRFAVKGHRIITHSKKLRDAADSVVRQREDLRPMEAKLAAVLWQLPRSVECDLPLLRDFLQALADWSGLHHVMEFRHSSWFTDTVAQELDAAGAGNAISDAADWPMWEKVTGGIAYVRLHGHSRTYISGYSRTSLEKWADKLRGWAKEGNDVYVFFDNTDQGAAPRDARKLMELVGE